MSGWNIRYIKTVKNKDSKVYIKYTFIILKDMKISVTRGELI